MPGDDGLQFAVFSFKKEWELSWKRQHFHFLYVFHAMVYVLYRLKEIGCKTCKYVYIDEMFKARG